MLLPEQSSVSMHQEETVAKAGHAVNPLRAENGESNSFEEPEAEIHCLLLKT